MQDIEAGYGGELALQGVSISARPATITAVLGANGAGKTALLRTISGVLRPRHGQVLIGGQDMTGRRPEDMARSGVAHVPEGQGVIGELTVEENLRLGALWRAGRSTRADALAELTGGSQRAVRGAPPGRRDAVRRRAADAGDGPGRCRPGPGCCCWTSPRSASRRRCVVQVMELTAALRDGGLTVLLVEQNARSALGIADQGIVLNLGKVVAAADAATLAADVGLRKHYLGF